MVTDSPVTVKYPKIVELLITVEKPKQNKQEKPVFQTSTQESHIQGNKVFVETIDEVVIKDVFEPEEVHKEKNIPHSNHILCEPHIFDEDVFGSNNFKVINQ